VLAAAFSARIGVLPPDAVATVTRHFAGAGLPVKPADVEGSVPDADRLMELMAQDKKVKRGKLTFILLRDIGEAYIADDVDPALVRAFLTENLVGQ
jgi:3-dehydroquinate synthetase